MNIKYSLLKSLFLILKDDINGYKYIARFLN